MGNSYIWFRPLLTLFFGKAPRKSQAAFTLLELIIVLVIIAILATLGINHFLAARKQSSERQACAMVKLIQAAERTAHLETGGYLRCGWGVFPDCNTELHLDLPVGVWQYLVMWQTPAGEDFWGVARRDDSSCQYWINEDAPVPEARGDCNYIP